MADQFKHTDQNVRNGLCHLSLLTRVITHATCATKGAGRRLANTLREWPDPTLSQSGDEPPCATLRVHVLRERRVLVDDAQDLLATEIRHLQKRALNAGLSILAEDRRVCWSTKYSYR